MSITNQVKLDNNSVLVTSATVYDLPRNTYTSVYCNATGAQEVVLPLLSTVLPGSTVVLKKAKGSTVEINQNADEVGNKIVLADDTAADQLVVANTANSVTLVATAGLWYQLI